MKKLKNKKVGILIIAFMGLLMSFIVFFNYYKTHIDKISETENNKNVIFIIEEFNLEKDILKYQIVCTDTMCLFRTLNYEGENGGKYLQFKLNNQVASFLKSFIYEIYSSRNSVMKDDAPKLEYNVNSTMPYWSIEYNLKDRTIKEKIPYEEYIITKWCEDDFKSPFIEEFSKYQELIDAITTKIAIEVYNTDFHIKPCPEKWITKTFHDEYYLPYNDISSHNYQ